MVPIIRDRREYIESSNSSLNEYHHSSLFIGQVGLRSPPLGNIRSMFKPGVSRKLLSFQPDTGHRNGVVSFSHWYAHNRLQSLIIEHKNHNPSTCIFLYFLLTNHSWNKFN